MAIKDIIAKGIGFTPGSVKFMPTHGFIASAFVVVVPVPPWRIVIVGVEDLTTLGDTEDRTVIVRDRNRTVI